jgi:hypothetical protein
MQIRPFASGSRSKNMPNNGSLIAIENFVLTTEPLYLFKTVISKLALDASIYVNTLARDLCQTTVQNIFGVLPMFYIGIDISKYKHDCFVMDENGEVIENLFSFENNCNGFAKLSAALARLEKTKQG